MRYHQTLIALSLFPLSASADSIAIDESLDVFSDGKVEVNGSLFVEGAREKPADLFAEVAKVIQGPEGSTILYLRPVEARKAGASEKLSVSGEPRPFVAEKDWTLFDAEGNVTDDPRFAMRVIMPYPMDVSAAMFDVKWNECEGPITGNYVGLPCNKRRGLSDDYMVFLKKNMLGCVNAGMSRVGAGTAARAHLVHDGTVADERHSGGSLHSAGRAIDVKTITTTGPDGRKNVFNFLVTSSQPSGRDRKFYEGFRSCWHKLHVARRCPGRQSGPIGTIGWEDGNHRGHHLHTSYPFCPNSKGYFITDTK